ncbi:MAG: coenzyme F420-0:L-glutamate ligase [Rhodobacteraceae bacterium]|nr:coenzyme F420-0:L-glutamate ligase [Paracoccaceae bacterium]
MSAGVRIMAIPDIPEIHPGDDLATCLGDGLAAMGGVEDHDILAIAHKVVSKSEGCLVDLATVTPSAEARRLAGALNKSPGKVEVILGESTRIVRAFRHPGQREGTLICEHRLGFISANAGVDESNAATENTVITLPQDPDVSMQRLGRALESRFNRTLGLVMTDTFGRPWRLGQVNVAVGLYRVPARVSDIGTRDAWGRMLRVTEPALADEIAAASGLVVRKAGRTPLVLMRGLDWVPDESTRTQDLLRTSEEDVFQ